MYKRYPILLNLLIIILFFSDIYADNKKEQEVDLKNQAQEHFDKARDALFEGIGHAVGAGAAFVTEQPIVGVFEIYQGSKAFKEMGKQYHQGIEKERECERVSESDTIRDPEPRGARDD